MTDWQKLKNNPSLWQIFKLRQEIIKKIREFFYQENFLEVQTPLLAPSLLPESYLEIFSTKLSNKIGKKQAAFLTPSPEIWHKKLLVAGSGNIFEITKSFRNTDLGGHFHQPEFTILEWYRIGNYQQTMRDCENLLRFLAQNKAKINYQGKTLDLQKPFEKISLLKAFEKYAGIEKRDFFNWKKLLQIAQKRGYQVDKDDNWETLFNLFYLQEVEPNLGQEKPTIIYQFPAQFAPLAKPDLQDPRFKQRFELYLFGIELADGYQELNDPQKQKVEFLREQRLRKKLAKINHPLDWDFIKALKQGLPQASGVALGVDRLIMIFANLTDISQAILFSAEEIFDLYF